MVSYLVEDPAKHFCLHDGGRLASLEDLFVELQGMEPHVWRHHVTDEKNDFAAWVRDVMGDQGLARRIEAVQNRDELLKLLFTHFFR